MNTIIIIDRQFGSGGLEIARRIAEKRGIPCFDRELIERAAVDSRSWSDEKLLEVLKKKDKERWSYYDSHAQRRWGQAKNYDFTINTARLGIDGSAEHILSLIEAIEQADTAGKEEL